MPRHTPDGRKSHAWAGHLGGDPCRTPELPGPWSGASKRGLMPHLRYESIAPVLIVERVQPTRDFFRDRLGFTQTAVVADGDELGFAMLEKDGVVVMVQSHQSVIDDVG